MGGSDSRQVDSTKRLMSKLRNEDNPIGKAPEAVVNELIESRRGEN